MGRRPERERLDARQRHRHGASSRTSRRSAKKYKEVPPTVASHKGFALPGFDQRGAAPRDVGIAAKANPGVNLIIYHSGYDTGDEQRPVPRRRKLADSTSHTVDGFIKSLRENNYSAANFKKTGKAFGNVPNVWAELGSVWRDVMNDPDQAAHLLGKLITHVGPKRVCWGTDSLWYGSPQSEIVALRRFEFTERGKELYNLPYGLEGDVEDPTRRAPTRRGRSATASSGATSRRPTASTRTRKRNAIACDDVAKLKDEGYVTSPGDRARVERRWPTTCSTGRARGATRSRRSTRAPGRREERCIG